MTVEELIAGLQNYDKDLRVAIIVNDVPYDVKIWGYENILGDEKTITLDVRKIKS